MKTRLAKLRRSLIQEKIDAFLVSNPANVQYLTGFDLGPESKNDALVILDRKQVWLLTDARYFARAQKIAEAEAILLQPGRTLSQFINQKAKDGGWQTLGFEKRDVSVARYERLKAALLPKLIGTNNLVETLRKTKEATEIEAIAQASRLTDQVFQDLRSKLRPSLSEHQVEALIRTLAAARGAEGCAFIPIVAVGDHTAVPHHANTNRKLAASNLVLIDFGLRYKGYDADMTRVLFLSPPTRKQGRVYETVLRAQETALEKIKPGMTGQEADETARAVIKQEGFGAQFLHSLGHGLGIEVHEGFSLNPKSREILKPGMVFTIEPGVYLPGDFGVRIEDTVVMKKSGVQKLTQSPKTLSEATLA
jgi:Xaa-Pro aminopeptidase